LRFKIYVSILKSIYSKTGNTNSNVNNILPTNRWINGTVELDIKIIFMALCKSHTKQLGIVTTSYTIYIQHYATKRTKDIIIQSKLQLYTKNIIDTKTDKEKKQINTKKK